MVLPISIILAIKVVFSQIFNYFSTLWVEGQPNEWVLIMNNGKMVKAGVGLRCFKGPFDQVARFPAKVYKVHFQTEQVTTEMQGVRVQGMLVWTVNRIGDGPFLAYKNLGDIASGDPRAANDSLISQTNAVVRSCIANSTMLEMITNRKMLREAIHKELFDVVKGNGVWLETIEITGVTICSNSLFNDMQTNYRESMRQQASLYSMQIKGEIEIVQNQNSLEVAAKEREINEQIRVYQAKVEMEKQESREKFLLDKADIDKEKEQLQLDAELFARLKEQELNTKKLEITLAYELQRDQAKIEKTEESQRVTAEVYRTKQEKLEKDLLREKLESDNTNAIKLAMMNLEKENIDEQMLKHEAI